MNCRKFILLICFFASISVVYAQKLNITYLQYIEQYHVLAQEQMRRYGIPASITLAQGIHESGAGKSWLAINANNHFGIKVSSGWNGPYVLRDDDKKDDKFRKYNTVLESYEDHSQFLSKPRYRSLFALKSTDYKGWARGLKACGYATNPKYADLLIDLIESYNLTQYDTTIGYKSSYDVQTGTTTVSYGSNAEQVARYVQGVATKKQVETITKSKIKTSTNVDFFATHKVYRYNKNYYIVVRKGDTLEKIADGAGVPVYNLLRFNELPMDYEVGEGDIIWFKKKKNKAGKEMFGQVYFIKSGESMYDICQRYGMKLSALYKLNNLSSDYAAKPGDALRLY